MLAIVDSGANIHLSKKATTTISPVIISNNMTARLPDGSTMDCCTLEMNIRPYTDCINLRAEGE